MCIWFCLQVPIQTKLVDTALLSAEELQWLNDYNAWTREKVIVLHLLSMFVGVVLSVLYVTPAL